MSIRRKWLALSVVFFLSGCSTGVGYQTVNTTSIDEDQAESLLQEDPRIKNAVLLIHEDRLLAGIRVNTFDRFKKRSIAKELTKELENMYPDVKVTLSADSKVLLETNKLIQEKSTSTYTKQMKKITAIVKEET